MRRWCCSLVLLPEKSQRTRRPAPHSMARGRRYSVEYLDLIPPLLEKVADLPEDTSFRIDADIRGMSLKQLGREPEPGFARTGRADDAGVEVAGVGRIFGPGVDGEQLRPGENDIVFKLGIDKGLDVLFRAPSSRSVFFISPEFLCVLAFEVDQQAKGHRPHKAHQPVKGIKPRRKVGKGRADAPAQPQQLFPKPGPCCQTVGRPQLQTSPADEQIGNVGENVFSDLICRHEPPPVPALWDGAALGQAAPTPV